MANTIRIFLVDDHRLVLEGLQQMLNNAHDMRVCGTACSLAEARAGLKAARPHILIVDLSLPDGSGLDLLDDPTVRDLACRVIVLSMRDEEFYGPQAIQRGARGFVAKSGTSDELLAAIRAVNAGNIHVSAAIATALIERGAGRRAREAVPGEIASVASLLAPRETTVFDLIGRGFATKEIAAALGISPKTVDTHRQRIRRKLRVTSASRLTALAIHWATNERPAPSVRQP